MTSATKVHSYAYPRPALTVDVAGFRLASDRLEVLLIERAHEPFAGRWALPGGFVNELEPLELAARRELLEETGIRADPLWPVGGFGDPGRDPRGWTVSVVYYALLPGGVEPLGADDARDARFFPLAALPPLAFDHDQVLASTLARLRSDVWVHPVAKVLIPEPFTGQRLSTVYAGLLGAPTHAGALRRRLIAAGLLEPVAGEPSHWRFADA